MSKSAGDTPPAPFASFSQPLKGYTPGKRQYTFTLLAGTHTETLPDGKVEYYAFDRGRETTIKSDKPLDEIFGEAKFKRVSGGAQPAPDAAFAEPAGEESEDAEGDVQAADSPEGEDKTGEFDVPEGADVVVFKRNREYYVYDKDNTRQPLHGDKFTTKAQVNEYLDTLRG